MGVTSDSPFEDVVPASFCPVCQWKIFVFRFGDCGVGDQDAVHAKRAVDHPLLVCVAESFANLPHQTQAVVNAQPLPILGEEMVKTDRVRRETAKILLYLWYASTCPQTMSLRPQKLNIH